MLRGMTTQDHRGDEMTMGQNTGQSGWRASLPPMRLGGHGVDGVALDARTPCADLDLTQRSLLRRSYLRTIGAVGFGLGLLWATGTLG